MRPGKSTVGLLIGFLLYVNSFYMPLRQLAMLWSSFQLALAGARPHLGSARARVEHAGCSRAAQTASSRVGSGISTSVGSAIPAARTFCSDSSFHSGARQDLRARRADRRRQDHHRVADGAASTIPTAAGAARWTDIRSYPPEERTQKIGFILQEPFLFTGTVRDNIVYGNERYRDYSDDQLIAVLDERHSANCLRASNRGSNEGHLERRRDQSGPETADCFHARGLRDPEILILDEATANIDTVTEQQLQEILDKLPASTTKVIIAHRLNTIANADEIFFINSGEITPAGSMEHAVDMLLHGKRVS